MRGESPDRFALELCRGILTMGILSCGYQATCRDRSGGARVLHVTILKASNDFIEQSEDLRRDADEFVTGGAPRTSFSVPSAAPYLKRPYRFSTVAQ